MKLILTLSCPDRPGIVHAVSGFLLEQGGNILEAAQFEDAATGLFFMRVAVALPSGEDSEAARVAARFATLAARWQITARFREAQRKMPAIIMVSRDGHCLNDLLYRCRSDLLPIDVRAVVSNHRELRPLAASYDIPFEHIPVSADTKTEAEAQLVALFEASGAELLVLARYMQVLSDDLCRRLAGRAINIHHSFLPSFKGARPYQQAHDRGVKLIGATAHYVTADLDEGPIIEQDVARADHAMDSAALAALGRDVESAVLARAVRWHAEHRILLNGSKTVIFR
jgi:formyltetrahydrofolate deformylase